VAGVLSSVIATASKAKLEASEASPPSTIEHCHAGSGTIQQRKYQTVSIKELI